MCVNVALFIFHISFFTSRPLELYPQLIIDALKTLDYIRHIEEMRG